MAENFVLKLQNLSKSFTLHEQQKHIPSCSNVHLNVFAGALTALTGPTGAGKSTALKCIYRSYAPGRGNIFYCDCNGEIIDLATCDVHTVLKLRSREIGFVTQFFQALPRKNTLDVVAAPLYRLGKSREQGRQEARQLLQRLSIPKHLWSVPPSTFSGGERQRVNLARGIISRPRLLLLDEPTASLDFETTKQVVDLINEIKAWGTGILAVIHDRQLVKQLAEYQVDLEHPPKSNISNAGPGCGQEIDLKSNII